VLAHPVLLRVNPVEAQTSPRQWGGGQDYL